MGEYQRTSSTKDAFQLSNTYDIAPDKTRFLKRYLHLGENGVTDTAIVDLVVDFKGKDGSWKKHHITKVVVPQQNDNNLEETINGIDTSGKVIVLWGTVDGEPVKPTRIFDIKQDKLDNSKRVRKFKFIELLKEVFKR